MSERERAVHELMLELECAERDFEYLTKEEATAMESFSWRKAQAGSRLAAAREKIRRELVSDD